MHCWWWRKCLNCKGGCFKIKSWDYSHFTLKVALWESWSWSTKMHICIWWHGWKNSQTVNVCWCHPLGTMNVCGEFHMSTLRYFCCGWKNVWFNNLALCPCLLVWLPDSCIQPQNNTQGTNLSLCWLFMLYRESWGSLTMYKLYIYLQMH